MAKGAYLDLQQLLDKWLKFGKDTMYDVASSVLKGLWCFLVAVLCAFVKQAVRGREYPMLIKHQARWDFIW